MTAFPISENYFCWWLTTQTAWNRLHAVPGDALTPEQMHDAIDQGEPNILRTACGRTLALTYAGIGSRLGMPRCAHCCRTLGIPAGNGTPVNEAWVKREAKGGDQ
jgi:hypothetical protein